MRTETVTRRVGEYLGPIDWDYDFKSLDWDHGGSVNPKVVEEGISKLRKLTEAEGPWEATTYGGWPRVGWGRVLEVGMYDGWPFWKPTPSVLIAGPLGGEWSPWYSVTEIKHVQPTTEEAPHGE